ncbi:hypothetical protein K8942_02285 [Candidatus Peribacteria bacterium]|nr:MAG: hypothetical protein K8942_02285 [Candidatus Peribacteria bacterium]
MKHAHFSAGYSTTEKRLLAKQMQNDVPQNTESSEKTEAKKTESVDMEKMKERVNTLTQKLREMSEKSSTPDEEKTELKKKIETLQSSFTAILNKEKATETERKAEIESLLSEYGEKGSDSQGDFESNTQKYKDRLKNIGKKKETETEKDTSTESKNAETEKTLPEKMKEWNTRLDAIIDKSGVSFPRLKQYAEGMKKIRAHTEAVHEQYKTSKDTYDRTTGDYRDAVLEELLVIQEHQTIWESDPELAKSEASRLAELQTVYSTLEKSKPAPQKEVTPEKPKTALEKYKFAVTNLRKWMDEYGPQVLAGKADGTVEADYAESLKDEKEIIEKNEAVRMKESPEYNNSEKARLPVLAKMTKEFEAFKAKRRATALEAKKSEPKAPSDSMQQHIFNTLTSHVPSYIWNLHSDTPYFTKEESWSMHEAANNYVNGLTEMDKKTGTVRSTAPFTARIAKLEDRLRKFVALNEWSKNERPMAWDRTKMQWNFTKDNERATHTNGFIRTLLQSGTLTQADVEFYATHEFKCNPEQAHQFYLDVADRTGYAYYKKLKEDHEPINPTFAPEPEAQKSAPKKQKVQPTKNPEPLIPKIVTAPKKAPAAANTNKQTPVAVNGVRSNDEVVMNPAIPPMRASAPGKQKGMPAEAGSNNPAKNITLLGVSFDVRGNAPQAFLDQRISRKNWKTAAAAKEKGIYLEPGIGELHVRKEGVQEIYGSITPGKNPNWQNDLQKILEAAIKGETPSQVRLHEKVVNLDLQKNLLVADNAELLPNPELTVEVRDRCVKFLKNLESIQKNVDDALESGDANDADKQTLVSIRTSLERYKKPMEEKKDRIEKRLADEEEKKNAVKTE